ncbi:DUF2252 domain-containing protein [Pseudofrankia inefficax]|uniref:DUF2252 domain-containing protein n=1 Tax=Pseudofrankia inefficax (strain DSM 45817 / CECT 9037 / DDB 130130 / EuI1c) TaxID=298654 RepID=E3IZQ3_PSEI1|nr:DUF2252 domain-containing protein [Pseudofrankia inefficax]ADP83971.1 Protein of unknown function DUF2252 [Pseudofrankia inefficax]
MTILATAPPAHRPPRRPAEGEPNGSRQHGSRQHGAGPDAARRADQGRAARASAPRRAHAEYVSAPDRADPIDLIDRQSRSRVPELVPLRYQRMTESPFRFYRGAAAIMASDLAATPTSGLTVQLCGDAHLLNFRLLASPERRLVFDINDFDETLPGPWEWDVKRFATSLVIAARANGFGSAERRGIVTTAVGAYRGWMHRFATMTNLDVWYAHIDVDELAPRLTDALGKQASKRVSRATSRARSRDRLRAFAKLTEVVDGERRFAADPPLLVPISELHTGRDRDLLMRWLSSIVEEYSATLSADRRSLLARYRLVDFARKVVGVGSVGTRCWVALLLGRDDGDPLLLQIKEAETSVLADHLSGSAYGNQGERVVAGQRLMQAASDIFLGWQRVDGLDGHKRDFYVRQLQDWKGIAEPERMDPDGLALFGRLCAATLARAHARSGDSIAIAAYLGGGTTFDRAVGAFAEAYADQNEADHAALVEAVRSGRVSATAP